MTIGERIKEARKVRKMTQKQLAESAGVATGTIQQYELGKREPRSEILIKIADALDFSVSALCNATPFPIEYLKPESIVDDLNKSMRFESYLHSLGYEILEGYEHEDNTDHALLIDHNNQRLIIFDGSFLQDQIEDSVETYTKFFIEKLISKGTEIEDTKDFLVTDPRPQKAADLLSDSFLNEISNHTEE